MILFTSSIPETCVPAGITPVPPVTVTKSLIPTPTTELTTMSSKVPCDVNANVIDPLPVALADSVIEVPLLTDWTVVPVAIVPTSLSPLPVTSIPAIMPVVSATVMLAEPELTVVATSNTCPFKVDANPVIPDPIDSTSPVW